MNPKTAVKWSFLTQITQFVLYFIVNITLSRILLPADFGTYAIIYIFIGFISTIKDFGIGSFLINKQELTLDIKNTVFMINFTVILALCGILLIAAPFIADFYKDDRLRIFVPLCSISLFIDGIAIIPDSMLQKNMNFNHLFIIRAASQIIGGVVAIVFALNNWGVFSLVFQSIIISFVSFVLLFYYNPFLPSFRWNRSLLRGIFSFSGPVFLDSVIQFWTRNIDNFLVGKIFGASLLGIYNRAYTLMQIPTSNLSYTVARVLFPYLAKNQHDLQSASTIYVKAIKNIAFISLPLMALLLICSEQIIFILYGEKWMQVVPLLKIFAIAGAVESVLYPTGSLFMALGKTTKMFRVFTLVRIIIISFIVFGTFYSVQTVAICYLIATVVISPIVMKSGCTLLEIKMGDVLTTILPPLTITLISGLISYVVMHFVIAEDVMPILKLIFTSLLFALVYLSLSFRYSRETLVALFKL